MGERAVCFQRKGLLVTRNYLFGNLIIGFVGPHIVVIFVNGRGTVSVNDWSAKFPKIFGSCLMPPHRDQ